jgi:predicted ATPase
MKKIAFNNFRRFQDFPTLELGKISIMVGRNNSGKSTMVKAILLALDYLQNQQFNEFSFANKSLEDANIVTFGRAKNNKTESNEIALHLELDGFIFSVFIYGNDEDTAASVSKVIIIDINSNINFTINYNENIINISRTNPQLSTEFDSIQILESEWEEIQKEMDKPDFKKSSSEGLRIIDRYNTLNDKLSSLNKNLFKDDNNESFNKKYILKNDPFKNQTEDSFLQEFVSDFFYQNDAEIRIRKNYLDGISKAKKHLEESDDKREIEISSKRIEDLNTKIESLLSPDETIGETIQKLVDVDNYKAGITKSIDKAVQVIKSTTVFYLGANPTKQSALFSIRDKQNNLAQAIHDFKQSKSKKGQFIYDFVTKWMSKFEVGKDFEIEFYAGEAYQFYVIDEVGNKSHLADKGMGSLQIMMVILKVATIISKHRDRLKFVTIIVEEPELNLHPEFQGKLADFFHDVNKEYQINFIIETHSEYLIRKSQNITVKESYTNQEGLNPNPFTLHYFDIENGPYEMKYLENGKFDRKFGPGFFDYADNLEVDTYKMNLKKNI